MPVWYAVAALGLSTISSERSRRAQVKAANIEKKQQAISNRRERIKALARARVQRSEQLAVSEAMGTSGGSGVASAVGSALSQTYDNYGFSQFLTASNNKRVGYLNKASQYAGQAALFKSASSFISAASGNSGDALKDLGRKMGYDGS